eukprot:TRINITY_DN1352_c0_g1_i2.p1 TRINITY_DN1352_c0_g1~~TRINITY_DN1352_c0_g1_i2.p1  ORF type:complete len:583 (-),score=104.02 TRINITY_DN1352_c0_g1_i2:42-1790(-)
MSHDTSPLQKLRVGELKEQLTARGLDTSGPKAASVVRLNVALQPANPEGNPPAARMEQALLRIAIFQSIRQHRSAVLLFALCLIVVGASWSLMTGGIGGVQVASGRMVSWWGESTDWMTEARDDEIMQSAGRFRYFYRLNEHPRYKTFPWATMRDRELESKILQDMLLYEVNVAQLHLLVGTKQIGKSTLVQKALQNETGIILDMRGTNKFGSKEFLDDLRNVVNRQAASDALRLLGVTDVFDATYQHPEKITVAMNKVFDAFKTLLQAHRYSQTGTKMPFLVIDEAQKLLANFHEPPSLEFECLMEFLQLMCKQGDAAVFLTTSDASFAVWMRKYYQEYTDVNFVGGFPASEAILILEPIAAERGVNLSRIVEATGGVHYAIMKAALAIRVGHAEEEIVKLLLADAVATFIDPTSKHLNMWLVLRLYAQMQEQTERTGCSCIPVPKPHSIDASCWLHLVRSDVIAWQLRSGALVAGKCVSAFDGPCLCSTDGRYLMAYRYFQGTDMTVECQGRSSSVLVKLGTLHELTNAVRNAFELPVNAVFELSLGSPTGPVVTEHLLWNAGAEVMEETIYVKMMSTEA